MPITLGSNIASLTAQRRLAEGTSQLSKSYERLSSGQRINRASDDAAGLAISDSLRAGSRIFNQGVRNLNDGISLLNIADSSIENLTSIVVRLEELAEQAANGTYGSIQRKAIDAEAQALSKEFFRISKTTNFNGLDLFSGSLGQVNLQAGFGDNSVLSAGVGGAIGTGTFGTAATYTTENGASLTESRAITFGDLNGDGFQDLVTAGYTGGGIDGYATVRLGSGSGSFGTSRSYAMETVFTYTMALGDLNGDGVLDLVTGGYSTGITGNISVRLGRGDGSFGSVASFATQTDIVRRLALGDLNQDGALDIVSTSDAGIVSVRQGNGTGTFGTVTTYSAEATQSRGIALGDLNNDGILDLVTTGTGTGGRSTVRLGTGNGTFGIAVSYQMGANSQQTLTLDDLNSDGHLDMITGGVVGSDAGIAIRLGNGTGSFGNVSTYAIDSGGMVLGVTSGDLNGDGFVDIAAAGLNTTGRTYVVLGYGNGTIGTALSYSSEAQGSFAIAARDLNGDGALDLATAGETDGVNGGASIRLAVTREGVSPLIAFSLKTMADARQALPMFQQKRNQLAAQRGQIGAFQSRIGVATNVLQVTSENFKAAESRIRDADIAAESADLTRLNILQQAAASVLAQANQQPALALRLLQGGV